MSTMNGTNQLARADFIESKIDKPTVGTIGISSNRGMAVESMGQALELAKLMAVSDKAVPAHLRNNPGACLAVAIQGYEWGINPFAIANKTYVVNDRLAYESALYQSVLSRRAPIKGRLKIEHFGEGMQRKCKVSAELADGSGPVEYTTPPTGGIKPKNSPLWQNDPDQQLCYFAVRSFARRHFNDVMMGVYTVDELHDSGDVYRPGPAAPGESRARQAIASITDRPTSEGQTFVADAEAADRIAAQDAHVAEAIQDAEYEPAQQPEPPPEKEAGPDVSTWELTRLALTDAMASVQAPEAATWKAVDAWLVKKGAKGKEDKKLTPTEKLELLAAVEGGRLQADGTIAE